MDEHGKWRTPMTFVSPLIDMHWVRAGGLLPGLFLVALLVSFLCMLIATKYIHGINYPFSKNKKVHLCINDFFIFRTQTPLWPPFLKTIYIFPLYKLLERVKIRNTNHTSRSCHNNVACYVFDLDQNRWREFWKIHLCTLMPCFLGWCVVMWAVWDCVRLCVRVHLGGVFRVRGIDESAADIWVWLRGSADTKSPHCSAVGASCRSCTLQNNAILLMG